MQPQVLRTAVRLGMELRSPHPAVHARVCSSPQPSSGRYHPGQREPDGNRNVSAWVVVTKDGARGVWCWSCNVMWWYQLPRTNLITPTSGEVHVLDFHANQRYIQNFVNPH